MTALEEWAEEWCREFALQIPGSFDFTEGKKCFMAGYELAVKHANAPRIPCPPGHDCPDCGRSYVEGIED